MDDVSQFSTYGKHKPTQIISAYKVKYLVTGNSKALKNIWLANNQNSKYMDKDTLTEIWQTCVKASSILLEDRTFIHWFRKVAALEMNQLNMPTTKELKGESVASNAYVGTMSERGAAELASQSTAGWMTEGHLARWRKLRFNFLREEEEEEEEVAVVA